MAGRLSRSDELFERARAVSPGGVHSPVRAFKGVGGTPRFMTGAHGAYITRHRRARPDRFLHGLRAADPRSRQCGGARRGGGRHPSRLEPGHRRAVLAGTGRVHHPAHPLGAKRALREFRHRGGDVGAARGARGHRSRQDPQVRWLLPRPYRLDADPFRLRPGRSHRARQRRTGPCHPGRHGSGAAERRSGAGRDICPPRRADRRGHHRAPACQLRPAAAAARIPGAPGQAVPPARRAADLR